VRFVTDGACEDTYTLNRTWTATDNCGNSITHVQVISVEDTSAPVWDQVMPVDITVECDGVPAAPAVVTASDNCDADVTVVFGEVRTDGSCPDTYTLTRTWTATDNCGNSITHVQVITVEDTTAPVWDQVMPADITVECDGVPAAPAVVTASDNCDSDVTVVFGEVRNDGACIDSYTLTRTWTATDNCGNETIHVQIITVEDITAPVWDQVMPVDVTVECNEVPVAPAIVTASDNCDSDVLVEFIEVRTDGSCPDTYNLTRTWTATDNCGNSITHVQVISVEDTTAPVWDQVMPVDITVECDGVPAAPAVVTASDNCDADVTVVFGEVRTDGSCPDTYTLTRTWTATDNCGNSITHVQVITVEDTTAPVWDQVMPVDITVECNEVPVCSGYGDRFG
jgi:large repetitive protein